MAKKSALGRGLGAILEDVELAYKAELSDGNKDIIKEIDVKSITENPYQPRKHFDETALRELSESIKRHGLIQPIIVIPKDEGYMLIAGERRFRATKMLGEEKIKAVVADIESKNLRELALIENIQREDLNPIELANSYKELIEEYKITQDGLAGIIHKSRTQITNTMRLLSLSKETQELIKDGKITQGHAKVIVGLDDVYGAIRSRQVSSPFLLPSRTLIVRKDHLVISSHCCPYSLQLARYCYRIIERDEQRGSFRCHVLLIYSILFR